MLYPLSNSPISLPQASNLYSIFCFYEFDCFRYLVQIESYNVYTPGAGLFCFACL